MDVHPVLRTEYSVYVVRNAECNDVMDGWMDARWLLALA